MESVLITCSICEVSYQAHLHTLIMCTGASSELVFSPVAAGHYLVTVLPLLQELPTLVASLPPETIIGSAAVHVEHVVVASKSIVAIAWSCKILPWGVELPSRRTYNPQPCDMQHVHCTAEPLHLLSHDIGRALPTLGKGSSTNHKKVRAHTQNSFI